MNKLALRVLAVGAAAALPFVGFSAVKAQAAVPASTVSLVVVTDNAQGGLAVPTDFKWTNSSVTYTSGNSIAVAGHASSATLALVGSGWGTNTAGYTITSASCTGGTVAATSAISGNDVTFSFTDTSATAYACTINVKNPPALKVVVTEASGGYTVPVAGTKVTFTNLVGPNAGTLVVADNGAKDLDSTVGTIKVGYVSPGVSYSAVTTTPAGYSVETAPGTQVGAIGSAVSNVFTRTVSVAKGFSVTKTAAGTWKFGEKASYVIKVTAVAAATFSVVDEIAATLGVGTPTATVVTSGGGSKAAPTVTYADGKVTSSWTAAAGDVLTITVPVLILTQTVTTTYSNTVTVSAPGHTDGTATVVNKITVGKTSTSGGSTSIGSKAGTSVDAGLLGLAASVSLLGFGAAVAGLRRRDSK